nr:MAG TPA: hypothetical protein [Caudoviricetes sp.]
MYISPCYIPRFYVDYSEYLIKVLRRKHYGQTKKYRR